MSKWSRDEFMLVMNLYTKLRYADKITNAKHLRIEQLLREKLE